MVKFTSGEVRDLVISMVVISLAFALFLRKDYTGNFLFLIPATFIGVVPGFAFHELAHKFMAIRYGFNAEFRMWPWGLFLAVVSSFFGVIFAAPGAVYIGGANEISTKQNGKISVVGPLTNIILAVLFIVLIVAGTIIGIIVNPDADLNNTPLGYLVYVGLIGFLINSWMAAFNMLPIPPLDGVKVFMWNKIVWVVMAVVAFAMAAVPFLII